MDIIKKLEDAIASNTITDELLQESAREIATEEVIANNQGAAEIRRLRDRAIAIQKGLVQHK